MFLVVVGVCRCLLEFERVMNVVEWCVSVNEFFWCVMSESCWTLKMLCE